MATLIDAPTLARVGWRPRPSARRLAVAATRQALAAAGVDGGDVGLLVNAGLYRDRNLGEPALAPLIQQDAGINSGDPAPGSLGTFSFDIANGACGVLTALQVADGFLRSGTVAHAVVTASDANPGHGLAPMFPYDAAGGALVCGWSDSDRGLGSFRWQRQADDGDSFHATVAFRGGGNILDIEESPVFAKQAGAAAAEAARSVLADNGLTGSDIDLVIASPARPGFCEVLSSDLGIKDDNIVTAGRALHTVAFLAALELAARSGRLAAATNVLFVCAGAGIVAGAALYRP